MKTNDNINMEKELEIIDSIITLATLMDWKKREPKVLADIVLEKTIKQFLLQFINIKVNSL